MDDFIRRPTQPVSRPVVASSRPQPVAVPTTVSEPTPEVVEKKIDDKPPAKLPPRARAPVAAIVVAILVSGGLIALSIFAYNRQQKNDTPVAETTTTEVDNSQAVQDASDSIDKTVDELDDTTDFSENDISDTTLNL